MHVERPGASAQHVAVIFNGAGGTVVDSSAKEKGA